MSDNICTTGDPMPNKNLVWDRYAAPQIKVMFNSNPMHIKDITKPDNKKELTC